MIDWTDELREKVKTDYLALDPNAENSMDIVVQIAEDIGTQPNRVRGLLSKAGIYVKVAPAAKTAAKGEKKGGTRVNKADAQQALTDLIESLGKKPDPDIISKLTGKAAVYLTEVFTNDD